MSDTTKNSIDDLYSGHGISSSSGGGGNTKWERIIITPSATGIDDTYTLPIIPQNDGCILVFINGIQTILFTYSSVDNSITFTDGVVPLGYNISAFILEKE